MGRQHVNVNQTIFYSEPHASYATKTKKLTTKLENVSANKLFTKIRRKVCVYSVWLERYIANRSKIVHAVKVYSRIQMANALPVKDDRPW